MSRSIMLDLETLGTSQDSVILTLGAVKFDPYTTVDPNLPCYVRLDVDEQIAAGRIVDEKTLEWWSEQPFHIREEALSENDRVSVTDFIEAFTKYCNGAEFIFSQGTTFDIILLENLFQTNGYNVPWHYWQVRDSRTLFDLAPNLRPKSDDLHNALADAYNQAIGVQAIYQHFGVTRN